MKRLGFLIGALLLCSSLQAQSVPSFKAGERVAFIGNSITHGGHYHSYIWLYYMTRFPNMPITVFNAGIGGECAWNMDERMDDDVFAKKPTYVTLTFGMNDTDYGIYLRDNASTLSKQRIEKSLASFRSMEEKLLKHKEIKTVMIGTSPYDETTKFNTFVLPGKNKAIQTIIKAQQETAAQHGWGFVDFNRPMCDIALQQQALDSTFTFGRLDRVHPDCDGQMVMAYLFLKAQGLEGKKVACVAVDAKKGRVLEQDNCAISNVKKTEGILSFDYLANALPYPTDSVSQNGWGNIRSQRDALSLIPFTRDFNQEVVRVEGLQPGTYQLCIDDQIIDQVGDTQLQEGVNLALYPNTPQMRQAGVIMYLNEERLQVEKRFREYLWTEYTFLRPQGLLFADNEEALAKVQERLPKDVFLRASYPWFVQAMHPEIRQAWTDYMERLVETIYHINKPVNHTITIVKHK